MATTENMEGGKKEFDSDNFFIISLGFTNTQIGNKDLQPTDLRDYKVLYSSIATCTRATLKIIQCTCGTA